MSLSEIGLVLLVLGGATGLVMLMFAAFAAFTPQGKHRKKVAPEIAARLKLQLRREWMYAFPHLSGPRGGGQLSIEMMPSETDPTTAFFHTGVRFTGPAWRVARDEPPPDALRPLCDPIRAVAGPCTIRGDTDGLLVVVPGFVIDRPDAVDHHVALVAAMERPSEIDAGHLPPDGRSG